MDLTMKTANTSKPAQERCPILVVDDRPENLVSMQALLNDPSWNIVTVDSGQEALALVLRSRFAVVLLDVQMPGMDGFETAELMRSNSRSRDLPVLFVTAGAHDPRMVFKGYEAGAVDYISKPIEPHILLSKVRVFTELFRRRTELEEEIERRTKAEEELTQANAKLRQEVQERERIQVERDRMHEELMETARKVGMAEIATSVLHNIGNAMNNVTVGLSMLKRLASHQFFTVVDQLQNLVTLHAHDLPDFIQNDERGKKLPSMLTHLGGAAKSLQAQQDSEIKRIALSVSHILEIIAWQQNVAVENHLFMDLLPGTLVKDAILITQAGMDQRHITVTVQDETNENIRIERHKALQILVNFLRNAEQAIEGINREDGKIQLTVRFPDKDNIEFTVRDNGCGISQEVKDRLFQFGFTTKPQGHGFGLHSCVMVAKEMGGEVNAASDGVGQGSCFTLRLPRAPKEKKSHPPT
jgi:signal transduction histidine kinase